MNIFNRLKKINATKKEEKDIKSNNDFYGGIGIIKPFTVLAGSQFNSFIGELAINKKGILNDAENKAFKELWDAACIDIDGFGNDIWNLKYGRFEIYKKEDITLKFEKRKSNVKDDHTIEVGRANFVYLSKEGNFIINQNDRNEKVFLVYVSNNISDRLLEALSEAEIKALHLSTENS